MKQSLNTLFKQAIYNPPQELSDEVLHFVSAREARIVKIKLYLYGSAGVISLALLFPAINDLLSQFTKSGFYEYFSLAFSSGGAFASYWQEFILSLIDSLPITSLMLSLLLLFIFLISIRRAMYQFKNNLLTV